MRTAFILNYSRVDSVDVTRLFAMSKVNALEGEKKEWHSQKNGMSKTTRSLLQRVSERRQHRINEDRSMQILSRDASVYI